MNALLVVLVIGGTAVAGVAFGVFSAYYAVTGLLAACSPSRITIRPTTALVPQQSSAIGD